MFFTDDGMFRTSRLFTYKNAERTLASRTVQGFVIL